MGVSIDVPADRAIRRVDSRCHAASRVAPILREESRRRSDDRLRRTVVDVHAQRAGHGRPDRSGHADCPCHVPARQVHRGRHRCDRGRSSALRDWAGWLLDRPDRLAGVLRGRRQPHAGDRQHRHGPPECGSELCAGSRYGFGLSRTSSGNVDRRAVQLWHPLIPPAAADGRDRRWPACFIDPSHHVGGGSDGSRRVCGRRDDHEMAPW